MNKTASLIELFSSPNHKTNYLLAKATTCCIRCGESANIFRDASGKLEYTISGLCQRCQDEIFKLVP